MNHEIKKSLAVFAAMALLLNTVPMIQNGATDSDDTATISVTANAEEQVSGSVATVTGETQKYIPDEDYLPNNDELFEGYVTQQFYGNSNIATFGNYGEDELTGMDKAVYDALKAKIAEVANGTKTSTIFEVNWSDCGFEEFSFTKDDINGSELFNSDGKISDDAKAYVFEKVNINLSKILEYLLVNCPYELYWYDKTGTGGCAYGSSFTYGSTEDEDFVAVLDGTWAFYFYVAKDYSASNTTETTTTNKEKTSATSTAVLNAKAIVEENAGLSDYQKLLAYKNAICELVSYNENAMADSYSGGYGDPWQLIYVFDKDENTNVVCEGYAKAFQYLCDMTDFSGDVTCYTVTGYLGSGLSDLGGHMWNVVNIDNGSYLVDVTNCDDGTVGNPNKLFLAGVAGSTATTTDSQTVTYYNFVFDEYNSAVFLYDTDATSLYGDSILSLAESTHPAVNATASVTINGDTKYYDDITSAFTAAGGKTAQIALLKAATVPDTLKINDANSNITLTGTSDTTLSANMSGAIIEVSAGKLTINSGVIENTSATGVLVTDSGSLTVTGTAQIYGNKESVVVINGATAYISGKAKISGATAGLVVENSNVYLSGGTFEVGKTYGTAVVGGYSIAVYPDTPKDLLDKTQNGKHYAYYDSKGNLITKPTDQDSFANVNVKVDECTHNWGSYTSDNNATCTKNGTQTRTCSACSAKETVTEENSITKHSEPSWIWFRTLEGYDVTARFDCMHCEYEYSTDADISTHKTEEEPYYDVYEASVTIDGKTYNAPSKTITSHTVNVTGGEITTVGNGTYYYSDKVTVKADEPEEGEVFTGWYVGDTKVSNNKEYTFVVYSDITVKARFESGAETQQEQAFVSIQNTERTKLANGNERVSLIVQWTLPKDCTFVEAGIKRSYTVSDKATLESSEVDGKTIRKNVAPIKSYKGTYKLNVTMGSTTKANTLSAVGYLTYEDSNGKTHTVYTDTMAQSAYSAE